MKFSLRFRHVLFASIAFSLSSGAVAQTCSHDSDCGSSGWCNESAGTCVAKLANGTAIPTDPPHTGPTLNGQCTVGAGSLVCQSGVCDSNDNKCGYTNGDGPCNASTGSVVCRSGMCSANGLCVVAGGCNIDADCSSGNWCQELTHSCTPALPNGAPMPSDPPHTNPALNGTCSNSAASLVCTSGVCDTSNNTCGYLNGDGMCTQSNASVVCDSGACSVSQKCEPTGGCLVDADCNVGQVCNAFACTQASADLSVAVSAAPSPVKAGSQLSYTITVQNAGPLAAASVSLAGSIPTGTTFVSLNSPNGWTCITPDAGNSTFPCSSANFSVGSALFSLAVQVGSLADGDTVIDSASVSSTTSDPNAMNNSAQVSTTVYVPIFANGFE